MSNILFLAGTCILMHNVEYKVVEAHQRVYLLRQAAIIHERETYYYEYWKTKYINRVAKQTACTSKSQFPEPRS